MGSCYRRDAQELQRLENRGLALGPNQPWTDTRGSLGQQLLIDKEKEIMA